MNELRGVFSGKVGTGMCGPDIGRHFDLSGLPMAPFYLKIGLDIGRVFAKCLIFGEFFLWLTYRLSKVPICIPIYMVKSTDLFKKGAFKKQMFQTGRKFSSSLV